MPPPAARPTAPRYPLRIDNLHYKEAGLQYHFAPHRHRSTQWFVCVHGGMTVAIDGVAHELGPEDALLVPPRALREPSCRARAPGYVVGNFHDLGLGTAAIHGRVVRVPPDLRDDLRALIDELRSPHPADGAHLVSALTTRLLIGLKRAAADARPGLSSLNAVEQRDVVARAEAFLVRNLHRSVARREVAAAVNLSEPHLARIIRAATGRSLLRRLTELRVLRAKALLLESTLSISQIAGRVGFSSFSHFTKVFRRAVGVPPSDYRRSGGKAWI